MKQQAGWLGCVFAGLTLAGCVVVPVGVSQQPTPDSARRHVVDIARLTGERQCERGGESLLEQQRRLEAAGVPVLASACGTDGRMYAAVCGGATGRLGIFSIHAEKQQAAQAAGFVPLNSLPDAQRTDCR